MTDASTDQPTHRVFDVRGDEAEAGVDAAVEAVRAGRCIVLPTDTVYGIGADAFAPNAVQGLLDAKNRGRDMPPPVLIADPAVMMALGTDIPDAAKKLAERFWPGALTLILKAMPSLAMDLGETRGTIAVRVPDHDLTRSLLRRTGPLAVSSANISGEPAATTADEAIRMLADRVAVYLDGGATPGNQPSTIVDFTKSDYGQVLRLGRLDMESLRAVVPFIADPDPDPEPAEPETVAGSLGLASWATEKAHAEAAVDPQPPSGEASGHQTGDQADQRAQSDDRPGPAAHGG